MPDSIRQKLILSDIIRQKLILPDYDKMPDSIRQKLILLDIIRQKLICWVMINYWIVSNKFAYNSALVGQNVHVHSGHIHVFCQLFLIFLLSIGVYRYVKNNYLNNGQI